MELWLEPLCIVPENTLWSRVGILNWKQIYEIVNIKIVLYESTLVLFTTCDYNKNFNSYVGTIRGKHELFTYGNEKI